MLEVNYYDSEHVEEILRKISEDKEITEEYRKQLDELLEQSKNRMENQDELYPDIYKNEEIGDDYRFKKSLELFHKRSGETVPEDSPDEYDTEVKYDERRIFAEALQHALSTYKSHYAFDIEPVEFIFAKDRNVDFFINSAFTYIARYGKKKGMNERDLFKAIHFLVIAIYYTRILKGQDEVQQI